MRYLQDKLMTPTTSWIDKEGHLVVVKDDKKPVWVEVGGKKFKLELISPNTYRTAKKVI